MDIKLEPSHIQNLVKLMNFADFDTIPVVMTSEAKVELTQMTADEIANQSYRGEPIVVRVDDAIIQGIPQLVQEFRESKDWYNKFNSGVMKTLGTSDGAFFLALMAAFSAQTGLEQNLALTVRAYYAIIADIRSNEKLLLQYLDKIDTLNPKQILNLKTVMQQMDTKTPNNKFRKLKYHQFIVVHGKTPNQLTAANKIIRYYLENNKTIDVKTLAKVIASAMDKSGDIKKERLLGGFKILNFALNLIDPSYKDETIGWLPVTIDSWMIYFFYPEIFALEKADKDIAKQKIFGGYKKYTYLAKIVQEQAHKFNMEPHQLQALLWISSIRKYRPNASTKDIHSTLEYMLKEFDSEQAELQKMTEFVTKLNKAIT